MFVYEKKLQYPVRIANPNPKLAAVSEQNCKKLRRLTPWRRNASY